MPNLGYNFNTMSGHSKWAQIKRKKGATDQKRGQAFSKISRMITLAAKNGTDPEKNFKLRLAIDQAKKVNMPSSTVERAISGASKEGAKIEEIIYEAYGPSGIALLIQAVTDNKNRASSSIRATLTKHGGSMGGSGSVSWMFEQKGLIIIEVGKIEPAKKDELELCAIDLGAEDIKEEGEVLNIYTKPQNIHRISEGLKEKGYVIESQNLEMKPKNIKKIEGMAKAEKILKIMDELENLEDVDQVYANFDIPDELLEKVS